MTTAVATPANARRLRRVPAWRMYKVISNLKRGNPTLAVNNARAVGETFEAYFGPNRIIFLLESEYIEALLVKNHKSYAKDSGFAALRRVLGNGLLTSEGQEHLRHRRMTQPAFHKKRIDSYAACMVQFARERAATWHDGQRLDIHTEMMAVTLFIISKTMFNANVAEDAQKVAHALDHVLRVLDRYMITWVGKIYDMLPLQSTRNFHRSLKELDEIIYRIIREHRVDQHDQGDLLSILLDAQAEDDGTRMSDQQLRDECITLFLAGHETTAVALSWTWLLLSQHPEVEARLHEEVDRVLEGRDATADDVERLVYTRQVLAESMRIYPPAFGFGRQATEDNLLGDIPVKKGDTVVLSQYITHRHEPYFANPEVFDPERWTPERSAGLPKFAYFPFGGGVRKCIGENFAWMEGILVLATVAQQWKMRLAPGHTPTMDPQVTLRPRGGMPMLLWKRTPAHAAGNAPTDAVESQGSAGRCPFAH